MKRLLTLTVLLALAAINSSTAALVLFEPFNYPDGNLVGASGSPWAAHSGAGNTPLQVASGAARIVHGSGSREDVNALLSGGPYTTNSGTMLYASFKVMFTSLPSTNGAYFAHFKDSASGFRCRVWASLTNATPPRFRLGVGNSSNGNPSTGQYPQDLNTGTVYQVVIRLDVATANSTIWLNPAAETDPSVTSVDAATGTAGPVDITSIALRQDNGGGTCLIDDLKVGTAFLDVIGANTPPTISSIPSQTIPANGAAGPLGIMVGDLETPASSLVVTGATSNPILVPQANIVFGGSGSNRTVTVTPAAGQEGIAKITLAVSDADGASTPTEFTISVGLPTLSSIPNQIIVSNTVSTPIPFTVGDAETPAGSLNITLNSANTALVPNANLMLGGSGSNRTVTITPTTDAVGFSVVTISVNDGTHTVSNSFTVTVKPLLGMLIDEPFNYADGTSIAGGATDWISHSGTFGQTKVSGGQLSLSQTNDEDFNREFFPRVFAPSNGVVLYASFKVNFLGLPTQAGNYFAHYKDDGTLNFRGRVFASRAASPAGSLRLGITFNAASIATNLLHPTAIATNTTHTIVTRYNVATGESLLWVDPSSESSPSVMAVDTTSTITVYSFAFRQADSMGMLLVDDLKIGTSYTDVADVVSPPPTLTITATDNNVTISWPTTAGYVLRFADSLPANPGDWADYGDQGSPSGPLTVVTIPGTIGSKFFELRKP